MARMEVLKPSETGTVYRPNREADGSALLWVTNRLHKFQNNGQELVRVKKGPRAATLTLPTHAPDVYGLPLPDRTINIPANSDEIYEPFSPAAHNATAGADAGFTGMRFDNVAGLEVTVVRPGSRIT